MLSEIHAKTDQHCRAVKSALLNDLPQEFMHKAILSFRKETWFSVSLASCCSSGSLVTHDLYWNHYTGFQYLIESTSNWQLWLSRYSLLRNLNTFISWVICSQHSGSSMTLRSSTRPLLQVYHAPELRMVAVLLVQPYQLSGTIFQPQLLKQTVSLFSVVDSRHICSLLLSKTAVNCNV